MIPVGHNSYPSSILEKELFIVLFIFPGAHWEMSEPSPLLSFEKKNISSLKRKFSSSSMQWIFMVDLQMSKDWGEHKRFIMEMLTVFWFIDADKHRLHLNLTDSNTDPTLLGFLWGYEEDSRHADFTGNSLVKRPLPTFWKLDLQTLIPATDYPSNVFPTNVTCENRKIWIFSLNHMTTWEEEDPASRRCFSTVCPGFKRKGPLPTRTQVRPLYTWPGVPKSLLLLDNISWKLGMKCFHYFLFQEMIHGLSKTNRISLI